MTGLFLISSVLPENTPQIPKMSHGAGTIHFEYSTSSKVIWIATYIFFFFPVFNTKVSVFFWGSQEALLIWEVSNQMTDLQTANCPDLTLLLQQMLLGPHSYALETHDLSVMSFFLPESFLQTHPLYRLKMTYIRPLVIISHSMTEVN